MRSASLIVRPTTRPLTNELPRSWPPGFGISTNTVTARVDGSTVGLTRATRPSNARPSVANVTFCPALSPGREPPGARRRDLEDVAAHEGEQLGPARDVLVPLHLRRLARGR